MILPFRMEFIPKTPQQFNLYTGSGKTFLQTPTTGSLGAITPTVCSNSQIYMKSVPQNYPLTEHIEMTTEDRPRVGWYHAPSLPANKSGCPQSWFSQKRLDEVNW